MTKAYDEIYDALFMVKSPVERLAHGDYQNEKEIVNEVNEAMARFRIFIHNTKGICRHIPKIQLLANIYEKMVKTTGGEDVDISDISNRGIKKPDWTPKNIEEKKNYLFELFNNCANEAMNEVNALSYYGPPMKEISWEIRFKYILSHPMASGLIGAISGALAAGIVS